MSGLAWFLVGLLLGLIIKGIVLVPVRRRSLKTSGQDAPPRPSNPPGPSHANPRSRRR